ncbi:protein FAM200B-like [Tachypleus tridentatus]|uniref:protein FAM200B-like n=1 Tax=Tachypleus tridentatus TaxID=6853 RepID=UPI003FD0230F
MSKCFGSRVHASNKLKRHLETNHPNMVCKPCEYFTRKLKEQKGRCLKQTSIPSNVLLAPYKVAHRVAKCKKPYIIAAELILLAAMDMVNIMVGDSARRRLSKASLFNIIISRIIQYMAENLNDQLIEK